MHFTLIFFDLFCVHIIYLLFYYEERHNLYFSLDKRKDSEMERGKLYITFLFESLKVRDHFGDLGVDVRIILK